MKNNLRTIPGWFPGLKNKVKEQEIDQIKTFLYIFNHHLTVSVLCHQTLQAP